MLGRQRIEGLVRRLEGVDGAVDQILRTSCIPGVALAVVADGQTVLAKGYGLRSVAPALPMTPQTIFPIGSTSKAINATLLGMLVDAGKISWDDPVQKHLPGFRLGDATTSAQVTVRDLLTMRTGLPRHDWVWLENPMSRGELVRRLQYLDLSAGFRERFQYNNLTATAAGYVAEVVAGENWEAMVRERIFVPLGMEDTSFTLSESNNVTASYCENHRRELVPSLRLATEVTAPSGGAINSTVEDMARWIRFNLDGGRCDGRPLIRSHTFQEICTEQIEIPQIPGNTRKPGARYALGWIVDKCCGYERISLGGYRHDVDTELMFLPALGIGIIAFSNFGPPTIAYSICQHVFELLFDCKPSNSWQNDLQRYETAIVTLRQRKDAVQRAVGTIPTQSLDRYVGDYDHPGYGSIKIRFDDGNLVLHRNQMALRLYHWHYDMWSFGDDCQFTIHQPHPFDSSSLLSFESVPENRFDSLTLRLEPAVAPIRFQKS